jgi:hypothetical protein
MTGHHPFSNLRKRMAPVRRARNARATRRMLELWQAWERSQQDLARAQDRPADGRRSGS